MMLGHYFFSPANFKQNSYLAVHEENLEDLTKTDKETPVNP